MAYHEGVPLSTKTITPKCDDYNLFVVFGTLCLSRGVVFFAEDLMLELAVGSIMERT